MEEGIISVPQALSRVAVDSVVKMVIEHMNDIRMSREEMSTQ
jgi:hypothetical protein